jgi:hypothetical protein
MLNSTGSVRKAFFPKLFTKSRYTGIFLVAQKSFLLRKLLLSFLLVSIVTESGAFD